MSCMFYTLARICRGTTLLPQTRKQANIVTTSMTFHFLLSTPIYTQRRNAFAWTMAEASSANVRSQRHFTFPGGAVPRRVLTHARTMQKSSARSIFHVPISCLSSCNAATRTSQVAAHISYALLLIRRCSFGPLHLMMSARLGSGGFLGAQRAIRWLHHLSAARPEMSAPKKAAEATGSNVVPTQPPFLSNSFAGIGCPPLLFCPAVDLLFLCFFATCCQLF